MGYTQQIYNHALHWTQRLDMHDHAERTKDDLNSTETLHLRRQQYLRRKRPQENWDATLWEISLLPLPKSTRHTGTPLSGGSHAPSHIDVKRSTGMTVQLSRPPTTATGNTLGTSHELNPVC